MENRTGRARLSQYNWYHEMRFRQFIDRFGLTHSRRLNDGGVKRIDLPLGRR